MHASTKTVYNVQHRVQDYWLLHAYTEDCQYVHDAQEKMDYLIKANPAKEFRLVKRTITIDEEVLHSKINL